MNRIVALLLVLALGMQSLAAAPAGVFAPASHDVPSHCEEMAAAGDHEIPAPPTHEDCACCLDMDMNAQGCASYCSAAIAVIPFVPSVDSSARAHYSRDHEPALLSRFDIPPTPPPIV